MVTTNLAGKSVIVTGGASGIGLAIVRFFAAQSTQIAILDISAASAQSVITSLEAEFPSTTFTFKKCDISSWEEQKEAFEEIYKKNGSIDFVYANAGVSEVGNFCKKDDGEPTKPNLKTVEIDLIGTLYTFKLAIHYLRKNTSTQKGSIVATASNAGLYPFPMASMYATSKHAVVGAVRSLAQVLEPEGIQINAICPNCIATGLADESLFANMVLTPMSVLVDAIKEFVTNPQITGVTAEISGEKFTIRNPPEYVDEITKKNMAAFCSLGYA